MERKPLRKRESFGPARLWRAALFASTGLCAVISLPALARAQSAPAANATPQGGVVVGGSASITQGNASTTIDQASQRAAINWQSFDVGSNAKVQFVQPDASAIALNRVVGGNLSQINGQINANGQIVLINQSGVVFGKGAQINAEGIIVSASDIKTPDFMAGKMNFSGAPNPGAKILNEGKITAGDAGLVGLIAPQVANQGVITAQLGEVVLAGASAFTLDLYGDRLISLDVTQAVRAVDIGGKAVPALITNSGVIIADGGKITLTAADADALVTQLINAGGTIRADSVGAQTGNISLQGVGGNISIAGNLLARGTAPGATGGAIQALADGQVALTPAAVVDASGAAGGGLIAIGTNLTRAAAGAADTAAPKAAIVTIAPGAVLRADATSQGHGGTVTLLSAQNTDFQGLIYIQGGKQGGNGGLAEISSDGVISLGGTVLATAIDGQPGEILLDPQTLIVTGDSNLATTGNTTIGGFTASPSISTVDSAEIDALHGKILVEATKLISVASAISITTGGSALSLISEGDITIGASIYVNGSLEIDATSSLSIGAGLSAAGNILLSSGADGTDIFAPVSAGTLLALASAGTLTEAGLGAITAPTLISDGKITGDILLDASANSIGTLAGFTFGGDLLLDDKTALTLDGALTGSGNAALQSSVSIGVDGAIDTKLASLLLLAPSITSDAAGHISLSTAGARLALAADHLTLGAVIAAPTIEIAPDITGSAQTLTAAEAGFTDAGILLRLGAYTPFGAASPTITAASLEFGPGSTASFLAAGTIELDTSGAITQSANDVALSAATLLVTGGDVTLAGTANAIADLGLVTASKFSLFDAGSLAITGLVSAGNIDLSATSIAIDHSIAATGVLDLTARTGGISQTEAGSITAGTLAGLASLALTLNDAGNSIASLGSFLSGGDFSLVDTGSLAVKGPVTAQDIAISVPTISLGGDLAATATSNPVLALAADDITHLSGDLGANGGTVEIAPLSPGTTLDIGAGSSAGTLGLAGALLEAISTATSELLLGRAVIGSQASAIDIDGAAHLGGTTALALFTTGGIFDNSGVLSAPTIEFDATSFIENPLASIETHLFGSNGGTLTGNLLLGGLLNNIGALGSIAIAQSGTFSLYDSGNLTLTNAIDPNFVIVSAAGSIVLENDITALILLQLGAGAGITQSSGHITTPTLVSIGSIGGDVLLTNSANSIGTLAGFTLGGNLDLADTAGLFITGLVTTPGDVIIDGTGMKETGAGEIDAANFAGRFTGGVALTGGNAIGALGSLALGSASTFNLADSGNLTIAGAIDPAVLLISTTGSIDIAHDITATLLELGGTSITQSGGSISTSTLASIGSIGGDVLLTSSANSIGQINGFTLGGVLDVADSEPLIIAEIITTPSAIILSGTSLTEGSHGGLNAGTLSTGAGRFSGDVTLDGSANNIGTLAGFTLGGNFALTDQQSLAIGGIVTTSGVIALQAPGLTETSAGALDAGTLTSGGGTVTGNAALTGTNAIGTLGNFVLTGEFDLNDSAPLAIAGHLRTGADVIIDDPGAIIETTGSITAASFGSGGFTDGGLTLASAGNAIGTISGFSGNGDFDLTDTGSLAIAGGVTAQNIAITVPTLAIAADLDANGTNPIIAIAADAIPYSAGEMLSPGGTIEIAPQTSGYGIEIGGTGANALDISNALAGAFGTSAAEIILGQALGNHASNINIDGNVSFGTGPVVDLTTPGTIGDDATLAAGTLAFDAAGFTQALTAALDLTLLEGDGATIGGKVILASTLNIIGTLGSLTTPADFDLTDGSSLAVTGPLTAKNIILASPEAITIAGTLQAANAGTIGLVSDSLSASAGKIDAPAGLVYLTPWTSGTNIDFGGSASGPGDLILNNTLIDLISSNILQIGGTESGVVTESGNAVIPSPTLVLSGGSIAINGSLSEPGLISLASTGDITEASGATIATGTLTGFGGAIGLIGTNAIATLAALTGTGDISVNNGPSLLIAGLISTGAADTITLDDNAGVAEISGGILSAGIFGTGAGSIGGDGIFANANTVGALDGIAVGGEFIFTDSGGAGPLTLGNINAGDGYFTAHGITIAGLLDIGPGSGTLGLFSTGGIAESTGTITALTLTGTNSGGIVALLNGNSIANLGDFSASNSIALNDAENLTIAGSIFAPASLTLEDSGNITEAAGGLLDIGTLNAGGTTIGGYVTLLNANTIVTLGSFAAAGNIALDDIRNLNIAGYVTTAGSITLEGAGNITESGGTLAAAELDSGATTITGNVSLTSAANSIGTLGGFTLASGKTFTLLDGTTLAVAGPLSAPTVTLSAPSIAITGTIDAATLLALESTGTITEPGAINTALLTTGGTTIGGDVFLTGTNTIASLGDFRLSTGTLDLADTGSLAVTGPLVAPEIILASGAITIPGIIKGSTATLSAGSIAITGSISLSSLLALASSGDITQSAGTITVPSLTSTGTIGGSVALPGENRIGTLAAFTVAHDLSLTDATALAVDGPVNAADASLTTDGLRIAGAITAGTLGLFSTGGITEPGGLITAGFLTGTDSGGNVALLTGNSITNLGNFTTTADNFSLNNAIELNIDGLVTVGSLNSITLEDSGNITEQPGGILSGGTLNSGGTEIGGSVSLANANEIGTLGGFTLAAGTTLRLNDATSLAIAGQVVTQFASISAAGIGISGPLTASSELALESSASITESSAGIIDTPELISFGTGVTGNVSLASGNLIPSLGPFTVTPSGPAAPGELILHSDELLNAGGVNAGGIGLSAPGINITGVLAANGVALFSTNGITEPAGGAIDANLFSGTDSGGAVTLLQPNNIQEIGNFTATGADFSLNNAIGLTIAGAFAAPVAEFTAPGLTLSGDLTDTSLQLTSTGGIVQPGGIINTHTLSGSAADGITLAEANAIGTLGGISAGGNIAIGNAIDLTIAGLVTTSGSISLENSGNISETTGILAARELNSGGTTIGGNVVLGNANRLDSLANFAISDGKTLNLRDIGLLSLDGNVIAPTATLTAGSIALNGNITAASALALQAAGGITQNAGIITTGLLSTGDATDGAITLNDANQVASLGTISGIAGLSLNDSAALSLTGPVTLPDVLVLHAASIGQAGGTISAAELTGSTTGAAVLTAAGNDIPTLGNFAAGGGLNLVDSAPLDLAGIIGTGPVLDLSDTGDINQTGGAVTTALLNANAANIALGQANAIAALGDISTNDLLINGAAALNGPLNASNATISNTTGNLALNGNARVAGTLALQTNGEIIQARGSAINAGTGVYTAGNGIELDGVDNFAGALNLTASNGNITQNAGQTTYDPGQISAASADITAARGSILLDGATLIDGDLNLAAAGSIIHNYGALVAGTLTGNAGTLAQFTGLTEIGTLGSFIMRDSNFDLDNTGSLTLTGPLVADAINITVNGSLLLDGTPDGGIFIAGPIEPKLTQNPQPGDSDITVNGTGSSITQTGQFNINNGGTYGAGLNNTNYPSATLFLSLTSGGLITLAPAPPLTDNGLQAPSVELFLYDGNGGLATGNVNLRALTVLNGSPTVTVNLSGYIDNVGGEAGAAKGFVNPFSQPGYRFNACPIGSVNCTILPIESLPPGNPLQNFDLTQRKRKKLNHDVHLPSVATRDF